MGKNRKLKNALQRFQIQQSIIKSVQKPETNSFKSKKELKKLKINNPDYERIPIHIHSHTSQRSFIPFTKNSKILLVGEGNFSFAASLASLLEDASGIIASCYDEESVLHEKYKDAADHIEKFKSLGGTVLFNIDATNLHSNPILKDTRFQKIVFNFPHVGLGIKNQQKNLEANQKMILGFLSSALLLLDEAKSKATYNTAFYNKDDIKKEVLYGFDKGFEIPEILITLKRGEPYDTWDVRRMAYMTGHLYCRESFPFISSVYPGYEHRRTLGFKDGVSSSNNEEVNRKRCQTYAFCLKSPEQE